MRGTNASTISVTTKEYGDQLLLPEHDSHEFREGYESAQRVNLALGNISAWNSDKVSDENPCGRRGDGGRDEAEDFLALLNENSAR
jgi:hypothetical protein